MEGKIDFGDFQKVEMRVGEIRSVEDHPNADKLFVMKVDLGESEERTIVAGLKGHYEKDDLLGRKAIFVVNLAPVSLRGVKSDGMILAAVSEDKSEVKILGVDDGAEVGMKVS